MKIEKGKLYYNTRTGNLFIGGEPLLAKSEVTNKIAVHCPTKDDWWYVKSKGYELCDWLGDGFYTLVNRFKRIGSDFRFENCHKITISQFKEFYPEVEPNSINDNPSSGYIKVLKSEYDDMVVRLSSFESVDSSGRPRALENLINKYIPVQSTINMYFGLNDKEDDKLDENKELVVGKWYKSRFGSLVYYGGDWYYGFDRDGDWRDKTYFSINPIEYVEATPKQVEEALIKEAKRRGYQVGTLCKFGTSKCQREIKSSEFHYGGWNDTMALGMGLDVIFDERSGKWAEVIELDKFAELKEAHKNGAVIQWNNCGLWFTIDNPQWRDNHEYRIKPEDKEKSSNALEVVELSKAEQILNKWYDPLNKISELPKILITEAMKEYAMECLKKASENAKTEKNGNSGSWYDAVIDKSSIHNENNLV